MADGLAAAIEDESHEAEADELFQRALKLAPVGDLADKIKNQQCRLADRVMRANAQGLRLFRGCAAAYAGAGTASTFRPNPPLDVEAAIGELAVGEALVSFLDHKRRAHPGGAGPGGAAREPRGDDHGRGAPGAVAGLAPARPLLRSPGPGIGL
jgi:hypothetical protein